MTGTSYLVLPRAFPPALAGTTCSMYYYRNMYFAHYCCLDFQLGDLPYENVRERQSERILDEWDRNIHGPV
jgi:hypothetical protein